MRKMRNCPFCNGAVKADDGLLGVHYNPQLKKWLFDHFCDEEHPTEDVSITVYGKTKQEVIDKWNGGVDLGEVDIAD